MTTGATLPFHLGFRMSGIRPINTDPAPQASQVRKNLFGPINHEESMKFVQDELNKISQADCKRWNFDFKKEEPKEGRYTWEKVGIGLSVPEMGGYSSEIPQTTTAATSVYPKVLDPDPTVLASTGSGTTAVASTSISGQSISSGPSISPSQKRLSTTSTSSSSSSNTSTSTPPSPPVPDPTTTTTTTPEAYTTTTTTTTTTTRQRTTTEDTGGGESVVVGKTVVSGERDHHQRKLAKPVRSTRSHQHHQQPKQTPISAYMNIRRRGSKRPAPKSEATSSPPPLLKRPRGPHTPTTTS